MDQSESDNKNGYDQKPIEDLKVIYETHRDELVRFAFKFLNSIELAEDVVQEVFIVFWQKRSSININESVKSYLFASVKNHSIDYLRSKYRRTRFVEFSKLIPSNSELPDADLQTTDLASLIKMCIDNLPEKCRIIFTLSRNMGMTYDEIASHLKISKRTVQTQIGIALKRIRFQLGEYWFKIPEK